MKRAFVDVGELGWSMYVNAHIRWLKRNTGDSAAIITYPDRRCLYEGLADIVLSVPDIFYQAFNVQTQNCLGLQKVLDGRLRAFFVPYVPAGYSIPDDFILGCKCRFGERLIFESYGYSEKLEGKREILIFPRRRLGGWYSFRNLPEVFYARLIKRLCDDYPELTVRTIGTASGAYDIRIDRPNYIDWVGRNGSLQGMIDRCQLAVAAAGSQSGPPKIALLQGVPTFMVGHQRQRHVANENWMGTRTAFYSVPNSDYTRINAAECTDAAISFISSVIKEGADE